MKPNSAAERAYKEAVCSLFRWPEESRERMQAWWKSLLEELLDVVDRHG